ncbi:phospholipase [Streptomyces sp. NPDC020742]|uniref:phospholipase n=1 Tax=Streptomyces sp. NPDC020742 TaxID=3154897 RepID=UPI003403272D
MPSRRSAALVTVLLSVAALLSAAAPAQRVPAARPRVLASWTQPDAASSRRWEAARGERSRWSAYRFDWSTDYCTRAPDRPLGLPFHLPCARHDFGYRNYKAAGAFRVNKPRLDSALYADLKRVCAHRSGRKRTACDRLAWTYYQAVRRLGH